MLVVALLAAGLAALVHVALLALLGDSLAS